eukprot:5460155-Amphidinium_carterae.1
MPHFRGVTMMLRACLGAIQLPVEAAFRDRVVDKITQEETHHCTLSNMSYLVDPGNGTVPS